MNFIDRWILNGITFDCGLYQDTKFDDLMYEYNRIMLKIIVYGVACAIARRIQDEVEQPIDIKER